MIRNTLMCMSEKAIKSQAQTPAVNKAEVPVIDSEELFVGFQRIEIRHRGDTYRLQITRQGKLILTK